MKIKSLSWQMRRKVVSHWYNYETRQSVTGGLYFMHCPFTTDVSITKCCKCWKGKTTASKRFFFVFFYYEFDGRHFNGVLLFKLFCKLYCFPIFNIVKITVKLFTCNRHWSASIQIIFLIIDSDADVRFIYVSYIFIDFIHTIVDAMGKGMYIASIIKLFSVLCQTLL